MTKSIADVAIWGHNPPPYGGMTVHISRLIPKLKDAGIVYQMYSFNNAGFIQDENVKNYSGLYLSVLVLTFIYRERAKKFIM
jgi:hypothetical protein